MKSSWENTKELLDTSSIERSITCTRPTLTFSTQNGFCSGLYPAQNSKIIEGRLGISTNKGYEDAE